MASKKKLLTAGVALATSAALLLGGTFAWQSINQTALNEASDVVNPGGRLHDDFDGSDKNVYVENFAEDEIFARVRFDEYMEIIMNYDANNPDAPQTKKEVITTYYDGEGNEVEAVRENVDTYVPHKFDEANATDDYWDWTMGGEDPDAETPYYMPTFNLNKDSLAADMNGVFNGANFGITDKDAGYQYANYKEWTDGDTKEGYEIYDGDTNNVDELSQQHGQLKALTEAVNDIIDSGEGSAYYNAENLVLTEEKVSHNAAQVNDQTDFISMADWLALPEDQQKGPFWVYDTDGWCYWAQPIAAGDTTGLLMDGIALDGVMDDTWYYAINVVAEFVTANDVGKSDNTGFYMDNDLDGTPDSAPTDNAADLLEKIGVDMSGEAADEGGESGSEGGDESTALPMAMTLTYNGAELEKDDEGNYVFTAPADYPSVGIQMNGGKISYEGNEFDSTHTYYHAHGTDAVTVSLNEDEGYYSVTPVGGGNELMTVSHPDGSVSVFPTDAAYTVKLQVEGYYDVDGDESDDLAEGFVYLTVIPAGGEIVPTEALSINANEGYTVSEYNGDLTGIDYSITRVVGDANAFYLDATDLSGASYAVYGATVEWDEMDHGTLTWSEESVSDITVDENGVLTLGRLNYKYYKIAATYTDGSTEEVGVAFYKDYLEATGIGEDNLPVDVEEVTLSLALSDECMNVLDENDDFTVFVHIWDEDVAATGVTVSEPTITGDVYEWTVSFGENARRNVAYEIDIIPPAALADFYNAYNVQFVVGVENY